MNTNRRYWLGQMTRLLGFFALSGLSVSCATAAGNKTPSQTSGPYYPDEKPNDNNDLVSREGGTAGGDPLELTGFVKDTNGKAIANAIVEIWQADHRGIYRHPRAPQTESVDKHFHGYGVTQTNAQGHYVFRTIVPVPYTGRPPHIHARVLAQGHDTLTTQLYLKDHPTNDRDGILGRLLARNKDALLIAPEARDTDFAASFEFVI